MNVAIPRVTSAVFQVTSLLLTDMFAGKKIGESCSGQNDVCLFSSCKDGFCKCDSNDLQSKNNMICGRKCI